MQSNSANILFEPLGSLNFFESDTSNFVTQTIDDTIFCCLGFKVYNDNDELIQTAIVSITGHDGSKPILGINFPDEDGVQAGRYEDGVPVLKNTKIYLHEDKSFTVARSKTLFAPVLDLEYHPIGFWVFRLNNLSVREYLPVDDIPIWIDKLATGQANFDNLTVNVETRELTVTITAETVRITDLLAFSDFMLVARNAGFFWDSNMLWFSEEPAPCEIYYLPNMLCSFDLTLPPSVGARGIIVGGTPSFGFLKVNSDLEQNRSIILQGTQAYLNFLSGVLNITADELSCPDLTIQSTKAVLNIEGSLRKLSLTNTLEGSAIIKQDVDEVILYDTTICPVINGNIHMLQVTECSFQSLAGILPSQTLLLQESVISEPIRNCSSHLVKIAYCDSILIESSVFDKFVLLSCDLCLGDNMTIERLSITNSYIKRRHEIAGTGDLYLNNVEFSPDGSLVFKKLREIDGHSYMYIHGDEFDSLDSLGSRSSFAVSYTWNVLIDLTDKLAVDGVVKLDLVFEDKPKVFMQESFRDFIRNLKLITNLGISVNINIVNAFVDNYDDYVTAVFSSMSYQSSSNYMVMPNELLVSEAGIAKATEIAEESFTSLRANNTNVSISYVKMTMEAIKNKYNIIDGELHV